VVVSSVVTTKWRQGSQREMYGFHSIVRRYVEVIKFKEKKKKSWVYGLNHPKSSGIYPVVRTGLLHQISQ
jgi:hypothetical protein